jgi:nucleoid DNA-binding protein
MNNKEFIAELSKRTGMRSTETQRMVSTLVGAMCDTFIEGNTVQMSNFGTFEVRKKMERIMVVPGTNQRLLVPPKLTLVFKPAVSVKSSVKKGGDENE